jgi:hypothetical protein
MRPQLQSIRDHNEDSSQFGDCHRTCIAMILDLDRDEVPHFMDGVPMNAPADSPEYLAAEAAERAWLAERGLTPVYVAYDGSIGLDELLTVLAVTVKDAAVILGCTSSSGVNHSVVYYRGSIYNPNINTIAGPMRDGFWWVTIYSHLTNPLSPAQQAPSVVTQERG